MSRRNEVKPPPRPRYINRLQLPHPGTHRSLPVPHNKPSVRRSLLTGLRSRLPNPRDRASYQARRKNAYLPAEIPYGLVFLHRPQTPARQLHVAPALLIYPQRSQVIFGDIEDDTVPYLMCLPRGLQGQWPGFRLKFPTTMSFPRMYLYYFHHANVFVGVAELIQ